MNGRINNLEYGSDAPGGFAVPVNSTLRKIIEVLRKGEEVEYGYLGVMMGEAPAPQGGAEIFGSQFGAPAQTDALLQKGDVIVAIGDRPVHDNQDLMLGLGLCLAGEKTTLGVVRRGGRQQKVEVTLAKYNVHENLGKRIWSSPGNRPYVGGLRVDYTSILAQKPHSRADVPSGVVVADVQKGSKAERCVVLTDDTKANNLERTQLGAEDIITQVAGVPVANPRAFYEQVARHNGPIELTLRRGNQTLRVRW